MGAVFNTPVLTRQFQKVEQIGLGWGEAGNDPDGFPFLAAALEFANPLEPSYLRHMRKAHLSGGDLSDRDAPPFNPAVPLLNLQELRGKNLPGGSGAIAFEGFLGCPSRTT